MIWKQMNCDWYQVTSILWACDFIWPRTCVRMSLESWPLAPVQTSTPSRSHLVSINSSSLLTATSTVQNSCLKISPSSWPHRIRIWVLNAIDAFGSFYFLKVILNTFSITAGIGLHTKIIRDGYDIGYLHQNKYYDFNFQNVYRLDPPVVLKPVTSIDFAEFLV